MLKTDLYRRTIYLDKSTEVLFGTRIVEYDMRSAGFNIIKHFKFLPEEKIAFLEKLDKHARHIAIGKLERSDEVLKKNMKKGFVAARRVFFDSNSIEEKNILSIKKDAIFLKDIEPLHTVFDTIEFVKKNEYESYFYLNKIEFYLNDEKCDCKGINDTLVALHQPYMLDIFREFSMLMRNSDHRQQLKFIQDVAKAYRRRELAVGYYRELNRRSLFRPKEQIEILNSYMGYNHYGGNANGLDISYNYIHYLIPLYRLLV